MSYCSDCAVTCASSPSGWLHDCSSDGPWRCSMWPMVKAEGPLISDRSMRGARGSSSHLAWVGGQNAGRPARQLGWTGEKVRGIQGAVPQHQHLSGSTWQAA
jgi:hypothetical protein